MKNRPLIAHAALLLFAQIGAGHAYAADSDGAVSGSVTDGSRKPVANANVALQDASGASVGATSTDATGHFAIHHVAPGTYAVVVAAPGYTSGSSIATASEGVDASVSVALGKSDAIDLQVNAKRLD